MAEQKQSWFAIYKRGQGTASRVTVLVALALFVYFACHKIFEALTGVVTSQVSLAGTKVPVAFLLAGGVFIAGVVVSLLIVNIARVVDFLIASEAELRKVSWPTRPELIRQAIVVVAATVFFCFFILIADLVIAQIINALMSRTT